MHRIINLKNCIRDVTLGGTTMKYRLRRLVLYNVETIPVITSE